MAVASKPQITNQAHGLDLPNSWRTLYDLTRVDDATWELALEEGRIHPEMERKDVALLLDEARRRQPAASDLIEPSDATCTVDDLNKLLELNLRFGTIYADPPC